MSDLYPAPLDLWGARCQPVRRDDDGRLVYEAPSVFQPSLRPWRLSWWAPDGHVFEYEGPWWVSGVREGAASIVAAIMAPSARSAKEAILRRYEWPRPDAIEWRFCQQMPAGSDPFSKRFPRADWMRWPAPEVS